MIKADIVKVLADKMNLNDRDALGIADHIIESLKIVIQDNGRLEIRGFGVFEIKQRKARIGRNPRNKKEYPIAPHKVVVFKPGKKLKVESAEEDASSGSPSAGVDIGAAPMPQAAASSN